MSVDQHVVLAHGRGIDDLLWFAVPALLGVLWLRWSERKARRSDQQPRDKPPNGDA